MINKNVVAAFILSLAFSAACSHEPVNSKAPLDEKVTREQIKARVESRVGEVQDCYARILNETPQSQGKVVVQWTIGEGGKVVDASIKSTELHSPKLEDCLVAKVKTWTFPSPPTGQLQVISYPFLFRAVD